MNALIQHPLPTDYSKNVYILHLWTFKIGNNNKRIFLIATQIVLIDLLLYVTRPLPTVTQWPHYLEKINAPTEIHEASIKAFESLSLLV